MFKLRQMQVKGYQDATGPCDADLDLIGFDAEVIDEELRRFWLSEWERSTARRNDVRCKCYS